ncbi:bleomycin resistance protein [Agrococcus sp. SGAir0287]|uniref:bleomycin resistance protein n=1 Tax=Agrococcus sp. SGAir0287 TaxID=2070347 RepID=UPI0010CCB823|nr:bleomycin resistance protein [Agrococcus sp. SGAir0287]QCR20236.1 bleomycin resistance protein [Agrococcus sp. SGAir0287]
MTDRAVPVLPSRSFDATVAFYAALGFEEAYRDDEWLILRWGEVQLEFVLAPGTDPLTSDALCVLRVADVDALERAIRRAGVEEGSEGFPRLHPVRRAPSGLRIGHLIDLDGSQLSLVEEVG